MVLTLVFIQIQETGLSVHDVKNESINEQKCAVLVRCVNSILYLYKKKAEMQFQNMNILLIHMCRVYLPLYQGCIDSIVLISSNVMRNIRNEVDKIFVRTK